MNDRLVFQSSIPLSKETAKSDTLAISCSYFRFRQQIDEFLDWLKIEACDRIAVPGGVEFFTSDLPKFEWAGKKWTNFLVEHHETKRVILIADGGCGWYNALMPGGSVNPSVEHQQILDMKKSKAEIKRMFPKIEVAMYFVREDAEGKAAFEEVK